LRKAQPTLDPKRLIFIDETAATTKMTRLYGRAPQGERLVDKVPHGHWKTTTFICGLRYNGVTAPFMLDGAMDGPHFLAYIEQMLAPTLKKGDIVFMDNVSTHLVDGVEEDLCQVKIVPTQSKGAHRRAALESHRLVSQSGIQRRMQNLPCKLGLRLT
jgi:hypothetical protein